MQAPAPPRYLYRFGLFQFDPEGGTLLRQGLHVRLRGQPLYVLHLLLQHPGEVVSREELRRSLWPEGTFVEFDNGLNSALKRLRLVLGDDAENPRFVETIPKQGYRFIAPVHAHEPTPSLRAMSSPEALPSKPRPNEDALLVHQAKPLKLYSLLAITLALAIAAGFLHSFYGSGNFTRADTVLLAGFINSTGDPVFDDTLRQGLAVQLEQSPFLSLVSNEQIERTLQLMGQPVDVRLTPAIVRDLCLRTQSAVAISGSIAKLDSQYIVGLQALNCRNGDSIADEQLRATGKGAVLSALDAAAIQLRKKLGESLSTIQRFDTPLEQATTPSLEALQAYTIGRKMMVGRDVFLEALPFFQRALTLDPNFAMAYAAMGSDYWNLRETALAEQNIRRAYALRAGVSEPERFYIESTYHHYITGDLEKAREVYELSAQTYPRYSGTPLRLWQLDSQLGQYEDGLAQILKAIQLDPSRAVNYTDLVINYIDLNQFDNARAALQQVPAASKDSTFLRMALYRLAFLDNDAASMAKQVSWAESKPAAEGLMLEHQAETAAYLGNLKQLRRISRRAIEAAMHEQQRENAAEFYANQALWESLAGDEAGIRSSVNSALALSSSREMQYPAALALAVGGDWQRAVALADQLAKNFPEDTTLKFTFLPTIRAQIALRQNDPLRAIDLLQSAAPYELGNLWWNPLGPVYVRGEAYLAAHRGVDAVAEFQKILDHRGIVVNAPFGVLAHLQLARACAMAGDKMRAKSAYEDFLTLWKDADPDIPILKHAKTEYAELQ
jgi:DNA-binding winged helix-turn-helix (wHTH) protein/tetratricopeptide (TPR) repeat protein